MYLFSQEGLKNLKISWFFLVFSSPFACSLQNSAIVNSIAAVTNLPTVISLPSATSSCPSKNSHIFLMRGGAHSRVLSVAFSSLGSETATCLFLALNGTPSIPTVFRPQPHFSFHYFITSPCWWNSWLSDPCFETTSWLSSGLLSGDCPLSLDWTLIAERVSTLHDRGPHQAQWETANYNSQIRISPIYHNKTYL